ncbi:MAG: hypothetical protein ACI8QC_002621 [Planctomycetota bacterium]|jgi:hypothetical protein
MSLREFRCGNCGADTKVSGPGVLVVICGNCQWSSLRTDRGMQSVGKLAEVTPLASHFQVGTEGQWNNRSFTVRGLIQLDHGAGPWNEWAVEDTAGEWFWIAEAQGEIQVMEESELELALAPADVELLGKLDLGEGDLFLVTELGQGKVLTAAGELPIEIEAGTQTRYADLQRGGHEVGSLDWTRGDTPEVFLGRKVRLEDLGLNLSSQPEHSPEKITAKRLDCVNCGAGLTIRDPEHALHLGCESCGSLLDVDGDETRLIQADQAAKAKLRLPLGSTGTLGMEELTVLGAMERAVTYAGMLYPWREYLLRTSSGGYRWLVESKGHWTLVAPIQRSAFNAGNQRNTHLGRTYKHFSRGTAEVQWVVGEFYWRVKQGDCAKTSDYVSETYMLSTETTENEAVASLGQHVESKDVQRAFGNKSMPALRGVGAVQPNRIHAKASLHLFGIAAAVLLGLVLLRSASNQKAVVYAGTHGPLPTSSTEELEAFTEPFEISGSLANLAITLRAPGVSQGWVGLNGALINMVDGAVTTFATSAQYYSGRSGGENWKEGNRRGTAMLGSIPSGQYRIRLAFVGADKGLGRTVEVSVRRQVTRYLFAALALVALLIPTIYNQIRSYGFEVKRWSESDHPMGSS